jgi:hypothetical protein
MHLVVGFLIQGIKCWVRVFYRQLQGHVVLRFVANIVLRLHACHALAPHLSQSPVGSVVGQILRSVGEFVKGILSLPEPSF